MNDIQELLNKIRIGQASWKDYSDFLSLENDNLAPFFKLAEEITRQHFGNTLKIYIPNVKFPAISVTGGSCALHCEHCNEKYLKGMKPITNNEELKAFLLDLHARNGHGILLSGGCEPDGSVPLLGFLDTIKEIKEKTNLIINTHTGLLNEKTAQKLTDANVDIVSFDVNMDKSIIQQIYHLDKDLEDYQMAFELLKKYELNVVPHICIGLYFGKLRQELNSLKFIKQSGLNPSVIVLIALIPPKSESNSFQTPRAIDIAKIVALTRFTFPNTEISLGCMRPRGNVKVEIEKLAIQAGINRIEIPSTHTIKWLKDLNPDVELKYFSACCAIPPKHEMQVKSLNSDIKRYLALFKKIK